MSATQYPQWFLLSIRETFLNIDFLPQQMGVDLIQILQNSTMNFFFRVKLKTDCLSSIEKVNWKFLRTKRRKKMGVKARQHCKEHCRYWHIPDRKWRKGSLRSGGRVWGVCQPDSNSPAPVCSPQVDLWFASAGASVEWYPLRQLLKKHVKHFEEWIWSFAAHEPQ